MSATRLSEIYRNIHFSYGQISCKQKGSLPTKSQGWKLISCPNLFTSLQTADKLDSDLLMLCVYISTFHINQFSW